MAGADSGSILRLKNNLVLKKKEKHKGRIARLVLLLLFCMRRQTTFQPLSKSVGAHSAFPIPLRLFGGETFAVRRQQGSAAGTSEN